MKTKNFPNRKQARRQGALDRLKTSRDRLVRSPLPVVYFQGKEGEAKAQRAREIEHANHEIDHLERKINPSSTKEEPVPEIADKYLDWEKRV